MTKVTPNDEKKWREQVLLDNAPAYFHVFSQFISAYQSYFVQFYCIATLGPSKLRYFNHQMCDILS